MADANRNAAALADIESPLAIVDAISRRVLQVTSAIAMLMSRSYAIGQDYQLTSRSPEI